MKNIFFAFFLIIFIGRPVHSSCLQQYEKYNSSLIDNVAVGAGMGSMFFLSFLMTQSVADYKPTMEQNFEIALPALLVAGVTVGGISHAQMMSYEKVRLLIEQALVNEGKIEDIKVPTKADFKVSIEISKNATVDEIRKIREENTKIDEYNKTLEKSMKQIPRYLETRAKVFSKTAEKLELTAEELSFFVSSSDEENLFCNGVISEEDPRTVKNEKKLLAKYGEVINTFAHWIVAGSAVF